MDDEELLIFENDTPDDEKKEKKSFSFDFQEYKSVIYTAVFYAFGLFVGSYFYKIASTDTLNELLKPQQQSILSLFASDFCVYFSLYLIVVFLGFCLIGYPVVNIIPTVIGIVIGIKTAYLFINYSLKGIGYSVVMLVPYAALFLTVITFTIQISSNLSKELMSITKKSEENTQLNLKPYIKKYFILALCIGVTALIDAGLTNLLFTVVTI